MRWCFLGSHEIPDGERMVMPARGGSHICVPCSETPLGQRLMQEHATTDGYRASQTVKSRLQRALEHWTRQGPPPAHKQE